MGFLSTDYENDERAVADRPDDIRRDFLLPDGKELTVMAERFRPPEMLFHPELLGMFPGKGPQGLHDKVFRSVLGCAEAIQVISL